MAFATIYPGALSAHFVALCYRRYCSVGVREAITLGVAMDLLKSRELSACMDVMARKLLAIQRAEQEGSSWEEGETARPSPQARPRRRVGCPGPQPKALARG